VHCAAPAGLELPGRQGAHATLPCGAVARLKKLAGHCVHEMAPVVAAKKPPRQRVHSFAPGALAAVPAGHVMQLEPLAYDPAGQVARHVGAFAKEKPGAQGEQLAAFAALKAPAGQTAHDGFPPGVSAAL